MQQAQSALEARSVVEGFLKTSVALAIGSSVEAVDGEKPLYDFGNMSLHLRIRGIPTISWCFLLDSLKAVEMRNRIFRELKAEVSVFEILGAEPLNQLALRLVSRSKAVTSDVTQSAIEDLAKA
jgi:hypothetical protein